MKKFIIASIFTFSSVNTNALEDQFYLKGSIGKVDSDFSSAADFSDSNGYSFTFGYKLNDHFSVEVGRLDLGKVKAKNEFSYDHSFTDDFNGITYRRAGKKVTTQTIASESITLGIAASKRIADIFEVGIRLGAHRWNRTSQYRGREVGIYSETDSDGTLLIERDIDLSPHRKWSKIHNDPYYGGFISWSVKDWSIGLEHTVFELSDRKPALSALSLAYSF